MYFMEPTVKQNTRYTLLHRAMDAGDEEAWTQLVAHYHRFILYVLGELQVNVSDREDVSQQVLLALLRDLTNYDPERGRFRPWLSAIIRNTAYSYFRRQYSQKKRIDGLRQESLLDTKQVSEVDEYIEREWRTYIATQAMARVKRVFEGKAVEVFELGLSGLSATEVATKTGLTVSTVYTLRKRVKKRLCAEILELKAELEP